MKNYIKNNTEKKYIVVHAGRRDDYQVALALVEHSKLECLVTDFYAPFDSFLLGHIISFLPQRFQTKFHKRYKKGLSSTFVTYSVKAFFYIILYTITKNIFFSTKADQALGEKARKISIKLGIPIISMNTYAKYAFANNPIGPKVIFQFHPHTTFVKNILSEEMINNPIAKTSLSQEYEFSVSDQVLQNLATEIHEADYLICASSVTAKSLLAEGITTAKIKVIPYGVETHAYPYKLREIRTAETPFEVIFIGSLNQRKGITYLLEALHEVPNTCLHIVGRGIFDENLLQNYKVKVVLHKNIPHDELVSLLQQSHCFVLPSLIEGFGQVILEAMATGIPVIASENTIGLDIIQDGVNGFVVPVGNAQAIRNNIQLLMEQPSLVQNIGDKGHATATELRWDVFRKKIVDYLETIA